MNPEEIKAFMKQTLAEVQKEHTNQLISEQQATAGLVRKIEEEYAERKRLDKEDQELQVQIDQSNLQTKLKNQADEFTDKISDLVKNIVVNASAPAPATFPTPVKLPPIDPKAYILNSLTCYPLNQVFYHDGTKRSDGIVTDVVSKKNHEQEYYRINDRGNIVDIYRDHVWPHVLTAKDNNRDNQIPDYLHFSKVIIPFEHLPGSFVEYREVNQRIHSKILEVAVDANLTTVIRTDYCYKICDSDNPNIIQHPAICITDFERITIDTSYKSSQQKKHYFLLTSKFPKLQSMKSSDVEQWYQTIIIYLAVHNIVLYDLDFIPWTLTLQDYLDLCSPGHAYGTYLVLHREDIIPTSVPVARNLVTYSPDKDGLRIFYK